MKKILPAAMISLLLLSTFSMFQPYVKATTFPHAWKDDTTFGLENEHLLLHGADKAYKYEWFWDYIRFKDTGTTWMLPWGELRGFILGKYAYAAIREGGWYTIEAFSEPDRAYIKYTTVDGSNIRYDATYTIYKEEPYLYAEMQVTNLDSESVSLTYNELGTGLTTYIAGDKYNDYYYIPGVGQRQFTGTTKWTYYDATELWVAMWDADKKEGVGMVSTEGYWAKDIQSYDWWGLCLCGEGIRFRTPVLELEPGETSQEYNLYLYFYTFSPSESPWTKVKNFYDSVVHAVPSAPRDLGALPRLSSIELAWNDPSDTGGLPIQSFRIYRGVSSGGETFIASVDGNTHKYVDSSVSTYLYFYYVTAVNSVGEGSPSNEVKCSSEESFLGLETVITLGDFRTQRKPFGTFTIQQNFEIAVGGSLNHRYWSQNVIWVWPITGSFNLMFGLFEIYESNDGGLTWDNIVPWRTTTSRPYGLKNLLTLRSTIEGDKLVMQNDCEDFEYSLTLGSYIIGARIRPPEIVIVGPPSISGIMRGTVTFHDPTSGDVETYGRIGSDGGSWLHGENWVTTSPHTGEMSENLKWSANGDFWYQEGASDQGLLFWPDYDSPTVLPP